MRYNLSLNSCGISMGFEMLRRVLGVGVGVDGGGGGGVDDGCVSASIFGFENDKDCKDDDGDNDDDDDDVCSLRITRLIHILNCMIFGLFVAAMS